MRRQRRRGLPRRWPVASITATLVPTMAKVSEAVKRAVVIVLGAACAGSFGCVRSELLGTIASDGGGGGGGDAARLLPPRFSPPAPVAALSDPAAIDEDPTFTADVLELYFMSTRAGNRDIWTARRTTAADPWPAPTRVGELDSGD